MNRPQDQQQATKVDINIKMDKQTLTQLFISSVVTAIAIIIIKKYILK